MSDLQSPATIAPGTNGAAPAAIRLYPTGNTPSFPQPIPRAFRRNFLDRKDPFEASGRLLQKFTFSNSYDLEGDSPQTAIDEIHSRLQRQLADGNLAETQLKIIDFNDASVPREGSRRFLIMQTVTNRKTVVTVNAYFRAYGDHLYYSVRAYILPLLSFWKLFIAAYLFWSAISLAAVVPPPFSGWLHLITLVGFAIHLRKFIIDLLAGDSLRIALRKQYPGSLNAATFDDDDATAFLKTNVSLTLSTIATVLEKYGIDTGGLRMIVQRMEINSVNTGGGSIIGAAIGGIANRIAAEVRT
jgi:hypothetical protein